MKLRKTILIVDDDEDMRAFLKRLLENLGHHILEATTVSDAFNIVLDEVPHLILLDIKLEGEIGFTLLDKINEIDKKGQIAVVMISALKSVQAIQTSTNYNVNGYLIKPINNRAMLDTIKKIERELDFEEIIFDDYKNKEVDCKCIGEISRINEISCLIKSKVKFLHKEAVNIDSNLFKKIGIDHAHFQVYENSYELAPGLYGTLVQFLGLNEKNLKAIRSLTSKKGS